MTSALLNLPDGCPRGVRMFIQKMETEQESDFPQHFDNAVETILELSAAYPWQAVSCLGQLGPVAYTRWAHAEHPERFATAIATTVTQRLGKLTTNSDAEAGLEIIGRLFNVYAATTPAQKVGVPVRLARESVIRLYGAACIEVRAETPVCTVQDRRLIIGMN